MLLAKFNTILDFAENVSQFDHAKLQALLVG